MYVLYLFLKNPGIFLKKFLRGVVGSFGSCDRSGRFPTAARFDRAHRSPWAFKGKGTQYLEKALIDVAMNFCILWPLLGS